MTRDELIEQAAQAFHAGEAAKELEIHQAHWECGNNARPPLLETWDDLDPGERALYEAGARALADAGLLHDHAQCLEINEGWQKFKHRKAEEVRELTAELEEWRSVAAAGGEPWALHHVRTALGTPDGRAVGVHAKEVRAERELALWLHAEAEWKLDTLSDYAGDQANARRRADSERDALQARIDEAIKLLSPAGIEVFNPPPTTYRAHPIPGYARSILRAALLGICPTLCDDDCETPCHEAHAIPRKRQHDVAECERQQARAALQGNQPTEPEPCKYVVSAWAGLPGSECIAFAEPGSDYCKPHGDALKRLAEIKSEPQVDPVVTPPDQSGRITDNGPIQPFTEEDQP